MAAVVERDLFRNRRVLYCAFGTLKPMQPKVPQSYNQPVVEENLHRVVRTPRFIMFRCMQGRERVREREREIERESEKMQHDSSLSIYIYICLYIVNGFVYGYKVRYDIYIYICIHTCTRASSSLLTCWMHLKLHVLLGGFMG